MLISLASLAMVSHVIAGVGQGAISSPTRRSDRHTPFEAENYREGFRVSPSNLEEPPLPAIQAGQANGLKIVSHFTPPESEAEKELERKIVERISAAYRKLSLKDGGAKAYKAIQSLAAAYPDRRPSFALNIMDIALLSGHYSEVRVEFSNLSSGLQKQEWPMLQLSLADAAMGKIQKGQMEFCREIATRPAGLRVPALAAEMRGRERDPRAVPVASCLLLSYYVDRPVGIAYLELGLKFDPKSVATARELIQRYGYEGRYSDIRHLAAEMSNRLPAGPARDEFLKELKKATGKSDLPPAGPRYSGNGA